MKKILVLILFLKLKCLFAQTFTYDAYSKLTAIDYADGKRIEYSYDKLGNRISEKVISPYCATELSGFSTQGTVGINYQWQVNTGAGFININDSVTYFGTRQDSLVIINPPTNFAFNKYRCIVTTSSALLYSDVYQFRIKATWQGNADTAWQNPANWECSKVPDQYVDVTIPSGKPNYPTVNSNTSINSLKLENGSTVNIKTAVTLEIKSRQD
jgi:YD repeat-containing protein